MEEREQLIIENEKLVYMVIKKLKIYNQLEDYYDVGILGLIKAADTYDKTKGYAFSTYAVKCIENEIKQEIRRTNQCKNKANLNCVSLNVIIKEEYKSIELGDLIPSDIDIEQELIDKNNIFMLNNALKKLSDKEQLIINICYGLNGFNKCTQRQIEKKLKISQAQISRIKNKAINKLKKYMEEE